MKTPDYSRMCFIAMPFGKRKLGRRLIDFDAIYQLIFRNAVKRVRIQNGPRFIPIRADDAINSRILVHDMLAALIRSRLMLADVSADNTNVGAEVATRYAWVPSGTVLVQLKGASVPFDFAQVQITDYSHEPQRLIPEAQARIAKALRDTLKLGAIDNPFFEHAQKFARAMGTPEKPTELGNLMVDAELAVRHGDLSTAIDKYRKAERIQPNSGSLSRRRAILLVEGGFVKEAEKEMRKAVKIEPEFPEADRWLDQIKQGRVPKPPQLNHAYLETRLPAGVKDRKLSAYIVEGASDRLKLPEYEQIFERYLTPSSLRKDRVVKKIRDRLGIKEGIAGTRGAGRSGRGNKSGADFGAGV